MNVQQDEINLEQYVSISKQRFKELYKELMKDFGVILSNDSLLVFKEFFIGDNGILNLDFFKNKNSDEIQHTKELLMFLNLDDDITKEEFIIKSIVFIYSKKHYNAFAELFIYLHSKVKDSE